MPPARARNIDDARSETSSSIPNTKEKPSLSLLGGIGASKAKRLGPGPPGQNGANRTTVHGNGPTAPVPVPPAAAPPQKDPSLPRTEWNTIPVPILRTYRIAHRLPVPVALHHPQAELIYKSSELAKRSPSAVYYRRKLHEQQLQRRQLRQTQQMNGISKNNAGRTKDKGKMKDTTLGTEHPTHVALSIAQSIEPSDHVHALSEQDRSSIASSTHSTYVGPRLPASNLAAAVRRHFNAQQLIGGEADTIARFMYVVQQNASLRHVLTEGSEGDGSGNWIGSSGREQRRLDGPGGEAGFRLRFRP